MRIRKIFENSIGKIVDFLPKSERRIEQKSLTRIIFKLLLNIEGISRHDYSINRETDDLFDGDRGKIYFDVLKSLRRRRGRGGKRVRREIARVWPSSRISIRIYLGSVISRTRADLCYISCRTLSNTPKDNRLLRRNNLPMYDKLVSPERCSLLVFVLSSPPFIVKLH